MGKMLDAARARAGNKLTPEQEGFITAVEEEMASAIRSAVTESEKNTAEAVREACTKLLGSPMEDKDGNEISISEQLRTMGEAIDKINSHQTRTLSKEAKFNLRKALVDNKDKIMKAREDGTPLTIEFDHVRAAAMITTSNIVNGATVTTANLPVQDGDVVTIRYPKDFIIDVISSQQLNYVKPSVLTREQDPEQGGAAVTAEGAMKPLWSDSFTDKVVTRRKIAGRVEFTEEVEIDFEELYAKLVDLFESNVIRTWQDSVYATIIAAAPAYTATVLDETIPFPNMYHVVAAGILSIQSLNYDPDVIIMNPGDYMRMQMTQDSTGATVLPPIMVGSNQLAGLKVITSNKVAAGKILIGESRTWKERHTGLIVRLGMYNDQFIKNEKTIVGELFTLQWQANLDAGSWIYLDIDTVLEALQKPAV